MSDSRLRIPKRQWDLPAGIHERSARPASLREVADPAVRTIPFHALSRRRQVELVILRIRRQRRFRLLTFGGTAVITKKRAIEALRGRTPLGEALLGIERTLLGTLQEEASRRSVRRRRGRP